MARDFIAEVIATRERHIAASKLSEVELDAMMQGGMRKSPREQARVKRMLREMDGAQVLRREYRAHTQAARRERECREAFLAREMVA